jgi:hypothetical protein
MNVHAATNIVNDFWQIKSSEIKLGDLPLTERPAKNE